jgi:ech hydrogenase subunit E
MGKEILDFCDDIEKRAHDLEKMIVNSYTIKQRMQGVGVMSEQLAKDLAVVGPVARGSNVPYDVRHAAPYLMYKEAR